MALLLSVGCQKGDGEDVEMRCGAMETSMTEHMQVEQDLASSMLRAEPAASLARRGSPGGGSVHCAH